MKKIMFNDKMCLTQAVIVSRKDVWQENPYVFVYDFELVK